MEIIHSPEAMTSWSLQAAVDGKRIGLVPTMGFFHEGHLSLMRLAGREADCTVVSLFVNPIQFGPREDLDRYPRGLTRDRSLAEQEGVDVLFAPSVAEMYPETFRTRVSVAGLTENLCGKSRPGHFEGVATVVAKLFNIVRPDCAVFGEKDFQQLVVIRRLAEDLNWRIRIIGHPTVREPDGLATSSRNIYLSETGRQSALCLYNSLQMARKRVAAGLTDASQLIREITELIRKHPGVRIEYVSIVDHEYLTDLVRVDATAVLAMAIVIDGTRLIDNGRLY